MSSGNGTEGKQEAEETVEEMVAKWTPLPSELMWTQNLIGLVKDGGVWATSCAIYKLHHKKKVLLKQLDVPLKSKEAREVQRGNHLKVKKVFEILGWTVEDQAIPNEDEGE